MDGTGAAHSRAGSPSGRTSRRNSFRGVWMIPLIPGIVSALYKAGGIGEKGRMKRLIIKRGIARAPAGGLGRHPPP